MVDDAEIVVLEVLDVGTTIESTGERLPTVVVDASDHPEIADLARVHAVDGIGDIATEAAAVPTLATTRHGGSFWR